MSTAAASASKNCTSSAAAPPRDIVLIGGGHAHVYLLKSCGLPPLRDSLRSQNVRVTLISRDELTPYSGMLPGYVAGHYTEMEMHIDLRKLCDWSGVKFVLGEAAGVEYYGGGDGDGDEGGGRGGQKGRKPRGVVRLADGRRDPIPYDVLGIDVGSSPGGFFAEFVSSSVVEGEGDDNAARSESMSLTAAEGLATASLPPTASLTPVKPISSFSERYATLTERLRDAASSYGTDNPFVLLVVGGGAGGVEVALAAQHALRMVMEEAAKARGEGSGADSRRSRRKKGQKSAIKVVLATKGDRILEGHNEGVRKIFERILRERDVEVRCGAEGVGVASLPPSSGEGNSNSSPSGGVGMSTLLLSGDNASSSSSRPLHFHECLWCTSARAPPFLSSSTPFNVTERGGFLLVEDTYQCEGHPGVFASGDCAHMSAHPRPKAGVFAVRAGPVVAENIVSCLLGKPLRRHVPQSNFLGLISTGDKYAVMSRGRWALEGAYLWKLKDKIDRRWMGGYQNLPPKR